MQGKNCNDMLHPLIDLEQSYVLLVCTRMQNKKNPCAFCLSLWQPRLNRGLHLQKKKKREWEGGRYPHRKEYLSKRKFPYGG